MHKLFVFLPILLLAGCGVETAGTAATVAAMKAKEAKQGQETKEQIVNQLEQANQLEAQRLKDAAAATDR